ncbi:MAG TPA: exo-alpha-sialidase, partial [Armatimonadota bacterium]|nr:exo-alpha-sialidase [Armatimonadota bacterium]
MTPTGLIESIEKITLRRGRDGSGPTWFHPRACMVPREEGPVALMTLQEIGGSDYFGPVHWSESRDLGATWSDPEPIPSLGRTPGPNDLEAGVCDVVPDYHPPSGAVLALGHNVFYKDGRFPGQQPPRCPIYAVRSARGEWSDAKPLEWDDPRGAFIYTNNCGQRVTLPSGDILLAFTFGAKPTARSVASVVCSFDGDTLSVREVGEELKHDAGRGLLEPSLTHLDDRYYLTMRAEDNHGYVAASDDGLNWSEKQPWRYDDGESIGMSTTQQHWLTHSGALFLVYTRRDVSNANVIRWRSPLWVAEVDRERLCLIRATEQVL